MKKLVIALVVIAVAGLGFSLIKNYQDNAIYRNPAFASGNGRLEATEVNISTKLAGKIEKILVEEGDYVKKEQKLVQMQVNTLKAELAQNQAMIKVKEAELASAKALVLQKQSNFKNAESRYKREKTLREKNAASQQVFENAEALYDSAKAEVEAAKANVAAGGTTALCINLLDMDLAHIGAINDIRFAVFADYGFFVDPPIGVGAFDLYFFAAI